MVSGCKQADIIIGQHDRGVRLSLPPTSEVKARSLLQVLKIFADLLPNHFYMEFFHGPLFSEASVWLCQHHVQPGVNQRRTYTDRVGVLPSQVNDFLDYWFELCFITELLFQVNILFLPFYQLLMLLDFCYRQVNFRLEMGFSKPWSIWSISCITPTLICCLGCKICT